MLFMTSGCGNLDIDLSKDCKVKVERIPIPAPPRALRSKRISQFFLH